MTSEINHYSLSIHERNHCNSIKKNIWKRVNSIALMPSVQEALIGLINNILSINSDIWKANN